MVKRRFVQICVPVAYLSVVSGSSCYSQIASSFSLIPVPLKQMCYGPLSLFFVVLCLLGFVLIVHRYPLHRVLLERVEVEVVVHRKVRRRWAMEVAVVQQTAHRKEAVAVAVVEQMEHRC